MCSGRPSLPAPGGLSLWTRDVLAALGPVISPTFGGQHRALAVAARKCPADQLFIGVRTVRVGGVDQRNAQVERLMDDGDGGGVVPRGSMS